MNRTDKPARSLRRAAAAAGVAILFATGGAHAETTLTERWNAWLLE